MNDNDEEEVLYDANPERWRRHPLQTFTIIGVIFGWPFWYLRSKAERLTITTEAIKYRQGILNKSEEVLDKEQVRSVQVKQSFVQRIFNVGDVNVTTAGDTSEIYIRGYRNPSTIREKITEG